MTKTMPKKLTVGEFGEFFEALHGYPPFSWQTMLIERVAGEGKLGTPAQWPDLIDLPTASGKTACMDVAIFALAMGLETPRRIWFVVDRRIVVDEAFARAEGIAGKLLKAKDGILGKVRSNLLAVGGWPAEKQDDGTLAALGVARLRGGAPKQGGWSRNPAQPAVITSTIDQLGSRLLFRGYGVGDRMLPIHAALAGNDSLIIVDEAHLAGPFVETVGWVEKLRGQPWAKEPVEKPFKLVVMSATPGDGGQDRAVFPKPEEREAALASAVLQQRITASKKAELKIASGKGKAKVDKVSGDEFVADAVEKAAAFARGGSKRIAVMVNRAATAMDITHALKEVLNEGEADVQLVTGRRRPVDRDHFVDEYWEKLRSGSTVVLERPIIVVTTQCLEVGADFSFDALVTECASLDALRQRFGRLNRLGDVAVEAKAVILARKGDVPADEDLKEDQPRDPVYGNALARTWNWLKSLSDHHVDMGIEALAPEVAKVEKAGKMQSLLGPRRRAPLMLPAYLDLWSQTNPKPALEPEVALFLHGVPPVGERVRPDVRVIWRREVGADVKGEERDLNAEREALEALPPVSAEMLTLPLRELREFLMGGKPAPGDDLEGGVEAEERAEVKQREAHRAWVWRAGKLENELCRLKDIRPQDVVVLSAGDGSFEKLCPQTGTPADVYEWAYWEAKRAVAVRLPGAFGDAVAGLLTEEDEMPAAIDALGAMRAGIDAMSDELPAQRAAKKWMEELWTALPKKDESGKRLRFLPYRKGEYLLTMKGQKETAEDWACETDDEEDERSLGEERLGLERHTEDVERAADWLAELLSPAQALPLKSSAKMHDFGKADPRTQNYLAGRRWSGKEEQLLAKSGRPFVALRERKWREECGVPMDFRHEALSMELASLYKGLKGAEERDLILHLIAAHHGYARPLLPVVEDEDLPTVRVGGIEFTNTQRREGVRAHDLASGVLERFWLLTRRYGWWGLAYLESLLRCADQHASAIRALED